MRQILITEPQNVIGKRFMVVGNSDGHNYPINIPLVFRKNFRANSATDSDMCDLPGGRRGNNLRITDCRLISERATKAELEAELDGKLAEVEAIRNKITFCDENEADEYNEELFSMRRAIREVESNTELSTTEKAIALLRVIKPTEYAATAATAVS